MKCKRLSLLVLILVLGSSIIFFSGCATTNTFRQPLDRIAFPEQEYEALPKAGTAIIRGQAFLKTMGGDVKTAAGEEVLLNPVTSYSKQWYEVYYKQGIPIAQADQRLWKYVRKTVADGDGRFKFTNVPQGEYFITTAVVWYTPGRYGMEKQGGIICTKVSVEEGQELEIILTSYVTR